MSPLFFILKQRNINVKIELGKEVSQMEDNKENIKKVSGMVDNEKNNVQDKQTENE